MLLKTTENVRNVTTHYRQAIDPLTFLEQVTYEPFTYINKKSTDKNKPTSILISFMYPIKLIQLKSIS